VLEFELIIVHGDAILVILKVEVLVLLIVLLIHHILVILVIYIGMIVVGKYEV
jgi:hypothetical protein